MFKNLEFSSVNTKEISSNDFRKISCIQKDMWAYGLGEYVKCDNCNYVHSKNDVFGHLSLDIRLECVSKLEEIFLGDTIYCSFCNSSKTDFIYDIDESIKIFMERYKKESFLVLAKDFNGEFIGFCDGYVGNFDEIYKSDLSIHYGNFDLNFIKNIVYKKLGTKNLDRMLYFSSLGTYEKYSNISFIYNLLRTFFNSLYLESETFGITELDKNNSLYRIYELIGSISLGLDNNFVVGTNENYISDLCVFPSNIINGFNKKYDLPLKKLLRQK